jgi:hypothetical protein
MSEMSSNTKRTAWSGMLAVIMGVASILTAKYGISLVLSFLGLVLGSITLGATKKGKLVILLAICGMVASSILPIFLLLIWFGFFGGIFVSH